MRTAERSGYLANRSLICSTYGSSRLARARRLGRWRLLQLQGRGHGVPRAVQSPRDRPAGEFVDLARRRISAHKATFMARSSSGQELPRQPTCRNSIAEQHQPLARFRAATDARRRQRQHLDQRQLVGDQIAVEQFLPCLGQDRQRQPQPAGQRVVAVERQAVPVGHGGEEQVQQHGLTRQMVAMLAQKTAIHPGPARRGRTPQAVGNQNAFLDRAHAWDSCGAKRDRTTLSQARRLAGRGHRLRTGAAGEPGHGGGGSWRRRVGWVVLLSGRAARGRPGTPARVRGGLGKCRGSATCVHDPAPGERPDGRRGSSSVPGCGPTSEAVHGTPAGRTRESAKKIFAA